MAKNKNKSELKESSIQSLQEAVIKLDQDMFALRNELAWNRKIEQPHRLKHMRKEKARVLTLLTLKQRSQENAKEA
ncbi:MAG TPA: 50S ribosomal protein L29 [Chlamydiales bacterium]|nr:50S ribosomal protein L29 [Chlamydiales bacterium]